MSRTYSTAKFSLAIWFSALALAFGALGDERRHGHLHRRNLRERYPFLNHSSCP